ncbi:hypothetical protein GCM10008942_28080 [Rhizomicrobium electricum]|uniref:Uncharacterized protein n=1 Tax=Rhizomicrobium electricum TaxID=480070 RepID=A0ABP3PWQ3_9PROT
MDRRGQQAKKQEAIGNDGIEPAMAGYSEGHANRGEEQEGRAQGEEMDAPSPDPTQNCRSRQSSAVQEK